MVALCGWLSPSRPCRSSSCSIQLIDKGAREINLDLLSRSCPRRRRCSRPNATGGVSNAIVGTIALTVYASILAIPVGRARRRLPRRDRRRSWRHRLRVVAQTMAGAPSILMGLFAFSFIVHDLNVGFSSIAGSFALAVLMLPVIIISTEIAVRNVPAHPARGRPRPRGETAQGLAARRASLGDHRHRDRDNSGDLSRRR